MHRASPTLLLTVTCLAASLLVSAPARAEESPSPTPSGSPSSTATPSSTAAPQPATNTPAPSPEPFPSSSTSPFGEAENPLDPYAGDELLTVNVVMAGQVPAGASSPSMPPPRARLPLRKGHYGSKVARLQERLTWLGYDLAASNTARDAFGRSTRAAVKAFQSKNWLEPTGRVNQRTWRALSRLAEPVGVLPLRCTEVKKALCIDKTSRTLRLVVKGEVKLVTDARFGAPGMETGEGVFSVREKSYNHTSSLYDTWMPRAMFFNGDEAVHYSPTSRPWATSGDRTAVSASATSTSRPSFSRRSTSAPGCTSTGRSVAPCTVTPPRSRSTSPDCPRTAGTP